MEKIVGIDEARIMLSSIIEKLDNPVVITVKSEPKSVLMRYDEYIRLAKAEKENKRLSLKLAVEKARGQAENTGVTQEDVSIEITNYRKGKNRGLND